MVVAGCTPATAEPTARGPTVAIEATGTCPSAAMVAAAMPAQVRVVAAAPGVDVLTIVARDGGAIARLTTAGAAPLEAQLDGRDCAVLAAAAAALADAWFVELVAPALPAVAATPPAPDPAPAPSVAAPLPISAPAAVEHPPTTPAPHAARWAIAVGRAIAADPGLDGAATSTALDLAWRSPWRATRLRGRLDWGDAATLPAATPSALPVARRAWTVALTAGRRLDRGRLWLDGAGGLGLVLSHIDPSAAAATATMRLHPTVAASGAAGLHLGLGISLRLELGARGFPVRDRYTLPPMTVARSPWAELTAAAGLEVALGERSW